MQEIWVVEYSPIQKAIHVETLEKIMEVNKNSAVYGDYSGYMPLFAAETQAEAECIASLVKHKIRELNAIAARMGF